MGSEDGALIREALGELLYPIHHGRTHKARRQLSVNPGKGSGQTREWHLDPGLPASRTVSKTFLLYRTVVTAVRMP